MIYLDYAATAWKRPPEVQEAVLQAMNTMGNAGRGGHGAALEAARMIYDARERLARLFHATGPERIAFTCNGTEALNTALEGLLRPGDHVITTVCEHNSVLRPLYRLEREGVEVTFLPAGQYGSVDTSLLEQSFRAHTKAVVITHASNLTGNITDLESVAAAARSHGVLLVVDAAQTAGILPVHVEQTGIDVLCFTGHKGLMGPQGTGGIYVREGVEIEPLKVGGSGIQSYDREHPKQMPEALEAGTLNAHGIAGLCAALRCLEREGPERLLERARGLAARFWEQAEQIPGVTLYGDPDPKRRVPIVALNVGEFDSAEVARWLDEEYHIAVRGGAHCAPRMHEALGTADCGAVRFSFSPYTTEEEVDGALRALREIAEA